MLIVALLLKSWSPNKRAPWAASRTYAEVRKKNYSKAPPDVARTYLSFRPTLLLLPQPPTMRPKHSEYVVRPARLVLCGGGHAPPGARRLNFRENSSSLCVLCVVPLPHFSNQAGLIKAGLKLLFVLVRA